MRIRSWFYGLTKVETLMVMAILSISALLLFRIPEITHYKGIYFNDEEGQKYTCPISGAHFEFNDMCRRVQSIKQRRK